MLCKLKNDKILFLKAQDWWEYFAGITTKTVGGKNQQDDYVMWYERGNGKTSLG